MPDNPLRWVGTSLKDLRAFPEVARREAGYQLRRVQEGLLPDDWKPMASVGSGVAEIRLHSGVEHRVCYVAKFADVALARKRLADVIRARRGK